MTRHRSIRFPLELDAEIQARALATNRSFGNVVVTLLMTATKQPEPRRPEPVQLPKIAPRHWS